MKIIIAHNYSMVSFAAMSTMLGRELVKQGNQVLFISHSPKFSSRTIDEYGVELVSWPEERPTGLKSVLFYFNIHKNFKPDVVISHFGSVNITMLIAAFFRTKYRVAYYHTLTSQILIDKGHGNKNILRIGRKSLIYSAVTNVIFVSEYACSDFKENYKPLLMPNHNIIYNGLPDRFTEGDFISKQRDSSILQFNFVGRIDKSKGIVELVEDFETLFKRYPHIRLKIAGGGSMVEWLIEKTKTSKCIEYIGMLSYNKVDSFLREGYFNICPSKMDNLPTVIIESIMNGVPVIAARKGGIPEIIDHEQDGFLFENHDLGSIGNVIERSINLPDQEYDRMKSNARKKFLQKFEMNNYIRNMSKFISDSSE